MLYSATKATLRKAFDSSSIVDDIAATHKVSWLVSTAMCGAGQRVGGLGQNGERRKGSHYMELIVPVLMNNY